MNFYIVCYGKNVNIISSVHSEFMEYENKVYTVMVNKFHKLTNLLSKE